jgi:hypothetical protein
MSEEKDKLIDELMDQCDLNGVHELLTVARSFAAEITNERLKEMRLERMHPDDVRDEQLYSAMNVIHQAINGLHENLDLNDISPFDYPPSMDGDNSGCEVLFSIAGVAYKIESKHIKPYDWLKEIEE